MMKLRFIPASTLLALAVLSMDAQAQYAPYWTDPEGNIVRSGSGGCVRTRHWTPEDAIPECGGDLAAKKAEEKPAAEPAPAAAVAAPVVAAVPAAPTDSDNDGVADDADKCADSPADKPVDADGCTIVSVVLEDVRFENNSAELTSGSSEQLDKAVAAMKEYPHIRVEVQAHSDSSGAASYNQALSEKRAGSVRDYMVSKGIAADRLTAKGYGEDQPIASNDTREGRAKNRRVELKIIE
jgi:OOP family OmpA-OmpF porin